MLKKILSTIFLVAGLLFIFQGLFDLSKRLGLYKVPVTTQQTDIRDLRTEISIVPTKIEINSLKLNLPVESTLIEKGTWPTSQTGVSFLKNSGTIGLPGNLIFYGHNWKTLLGNLKNIKVKDEIVLTDATGKNFIYTVAYIAQVDQKDVSILNNTTDERLTLYTCIGLLDQKRLVVVAKRV
jgi:LPXTG-site transpeptidase (sortase) family protein